MAAEFQWCCDIVYFIHEITECRAVTRQKGEKILRRAEDWECFQWKTFRSCSRRDACSFPHTHATGDREDNVEWSGDTQEILTKSKQETDWRKSLYNPQASPATWAENPLSTVCDYRHHPVCRGYKQMHSWLLLLMSTSWWWEKPQREVKEQLLFWGKKKKSPRLCISTLSAKEFYSTESLRIGIVNASAGHTMKFSQCTWYETKIRERKRHSVEFVQKGEPHERNPYAPSLEEQPPEETSWQAGCDSKTAWNLARKYASSKSEDNYVLFSCEGARDTEYRMFVMDSGASMHNVEQGEMSSDTMDTLRRSNTPHATHRDLGQCKQKSKHQLLFMISICS